MNQTEEITSGYSLFFTITSSLLFIHKYTVNRFYVIKKAQVEGCTRHKLLEGRTMCTNFIALSSADQ